MIHPTRLMTRPLRRDFFRLHGGGHLPRVVSEVVSIRGRHEKRPPDKYPEAA